MSLSRPRFLLRYVDRYGNGRSIEVCGPRDRAEEFAALMRSEYGAFGPVDLTGNTMIIPLGSVLYVVGANGTSNTFTASVSGPTLTVDDGSGPQSFNSADFPAVAFFGGDHADVFSIVLPGHQVTVYSRGGNDAVSLTTGNGTLLFNGGSSTVDLMDAGLASPSQYVVTAQAGANVGGQVHAPAYVQPRNLGGTINVTQV